jgi:hypothetical protein
MNDWINSWPAIILLGVILPPAAILLIAQLFGAWIPDYRDRHQRAYRRTWQDMQHTQTLEHDVWPDKTSEWFGHKSCNRCSGGHTHSISIEPGRSKVVKPPLEVGEPTTWIEVTALGDTRKYYVPGGPA